MATATDPLVKLDANDRINLLFAVRTRLELLRGFVSSNTGTAAYWQKEIDDLIDLYERLTGRVFVEREG